MSVLDRAEQLKNELDSMRPLDGEREARIMQKFRLDWNYHSNNLEGNSLTYGETKALILFGITAQGKPLKDHFEITGHNEAINWILDLVKGEMELTEHFIRQLHTLLLKESSYKEALTPDGKPTRRKIEVGKYKSQPNHVITVTGETFYFATPEETPARMHDLLEWFRKEKEKPNVNPIILAALFHYRFIRIHPFDDGNGRTARILMNFILMQFGYPPVIIKTDDKENYYAVLRLADADELEPFIEYIAENLIHSLEIMIKGAKGESIEEADDLEKELALLDAKLQKGDQEAKVLKTKKLITQVLSKSVRPLIIDFISSCKKFERFYLDSSIYISISGDLHRDGTEGLEINDTDDIKEIYSFIDGKFDVIGENIYSINLTYHFKHFNRINYEGFNFASKISIRFSKREYVVTTEKSKIKVSKHYLNIISDEEKKKIISAENQTHLSKIEQKTK